jgi:hypothetical protein
MAEAIELSFGQALRGILATLQVPDIEGDRLHDLISRVGHTSKLQIPTTPSLTS